VCPAGDLGGKAQVAEGVAGGLAAIAGGLVQMRSAGSRLPGGLTAAPRAGPAAGSRDGGRRRR